ncbi:MAG: DUF2520 domain-containing protein [Bacteroidetes bacterium]|nr:DUF2520 domain-containing protein [Bacteroidota bacterium]
MAAITLIGSGNAATALGRALHKAGHQIVQVWSRSEAHAAQLAKELNAAPTADLQNINGNADIYILSVKDDAIEATAKALPVSGKILAHTSGIKSKDLLHSSGRYGIFYPFVSMTRDAETDFHTALLMVEGNNEETLKTLAALAQTISDRVRQVEERDRQSLHLAAVFANNFTNYLYTVSEQLLAESGLSFDELRPLIAAHVQRVMEQSPGQLQTGPAIRRDHSTIDVHLDLLSKHQNLKELYSLLTSSIQDIYPTT